jgi:hypothetical protein
MILGLVFSTQKILLCIAIILEMLASVKGHGGWNILSYLVDSHSAYSGISLQGGMGQKDATCTSVD